MYVRLRPFKCVSNCKSNTFEQVESLYSIVGMFILVSLLRRARKKYNIHGNHCQVGL